MLAGSHLTLSFGGMVICFNATTDAHTALDSLMSTGRYRDINTAISAALCTQSVLEKEVSESGGLVVGAKSVSSVSEPTPPPYSSSSASPITFPLLARPAQPLDRTRFLGLSLLEPKIHSFEVLGPKDWPWGQFNKFLPVKVTCRACLNLLIQNPGIRATDAAEAIAAVASQFGTLLRQADDASSRRKDEAFSSAFPSRGKTGDKSLERFAEQFVFGGRSFENSSFPILLGLVRLEGQNVRLTEAGFRMAEMANPLLDGVVAQSAEKFSEEELSFLRSHIKISVGSERNALAAILGAIRAGANNPNAIDQYIRQSFLASTKDSKDSFIATQRTGAVSRAVELKLIRRERQGIRVAYLLEELGEQFLEQ